MRYQYPQREEAPFGARFQEVASVALEQLSKDEVNKNSFTTVCFDESSEVFCTACYFEERLPLLELGRVVLGPYTLRTDMAEKFPFIPGFAIGHTIGLLQLFIKEYSHKNEMYRAFDDAASFHFVQIAKYVEENVNQAISLDSIAQSLKLSKPYICKIVKKTTNYTVSQFIAKAKINMAKVLFWNGFTDIHEISLILGYKSQSYFSRQFKAIEQKSPTGYMKDMDQINKEYM